MVKDTKQDFHTALKEKADNFAYGVYRVTKAFPKEEIYGLTSQLRRASLSVVLNCIEGYARVGDKEHKHFLQIAYGSLKESKYLLFFAYREKYLDKKEYDMLMGTAEDIGGMLWGTIRNLSQSDMIQVSRFKIQAL